ncbi:MAG: S1 RNA-binding domain-containing protein [Anaerolineae bacterium]|nr:S1 RNA-binding domain-containing protein [Anaerolineae bacterium]
MRSICDFGVFVDLGGVDGLVHISELAWRRVDHPSEVVQEGQEIEVYVLGVDRERQRVALSMRRLEPEPWSLLEQMYQVGQVVEATITRLAEFGAFALLDSGVEGLIHISELAPHHVNHPREVVREGDVVQVRILRIEPERRRLALSLKEADEAYLEVDWDVLEPSESEEETNQREDAGGKAGGERPTTEEETGSEPTGEG